MNMLKYASPFVPLASKTGLHAMSTAPKATVPSKRPAQLNINIRNQQQANKFPNALPQQSGKYSVGNFIRRFPPTPAGVSYRVVNPVPNSSSVQDNINAHTDSLNRSGLYPEKLSPMDSKAEDWLSLDVSPENTIYQVDGRDAANWLWDRRGLQFTNAQWDRANKARQNVTSQLGKLPQAISYAWSSDNEGIMGTAYSLPFNRDTYKNNQSFNIFNHKYFDQPYEYNMYDGYGLKQQHGQLQEPWQRFMDFQETQDHELSHSFNDVLSDTPDTDDEELDLDLEVPYEKDIFFRKTNNPEQPYYDDATTSQRAKDYSQLFSGTYLQRPAEYIGAMSRVKRYGAELGFDTTSQDPTTARNAMAQTLHYFATHQKPEELTSEQQRLHYWLNTAARNHGSNEQHLLQQQREQGINPGKVNYSNYTEGAQSPFYKDVLNFMTDSTIQGLVRNDVPSNNATALQNLRQGYA